MKAEDLVLEQYQEQLVDHLCAQKRALAFVGMGLGKTASSLSAIARLYADWQTRGVLVVAPLRVANLTWPNELRRWKQFHWMKVANLRTKEGWRMLEQGTAHIYIINYESLPKLVAKYLQGRKAPPAFDTVVFDETTKAKNHKSARIKQLRPHLERWIDRRWGLTGTPNPNSLMELFGQVRLIDDGKRLGPSFERFREAYFYPIDYNEYDWRIKEGADDKIYAKISDITLVLRSSDYLDIADTVLTDIEVTLNDEARRVYDQVEEDLVAVLPDGDIEVLAPNAAALSNKLVQIVGGSVYVGEAGSGDWAPIHDDKLVALEKLLKTIDEPVLVMCNYRHERSRILERFPKAVEWSDDILDSWNRGEVPMIVADPRSIGHGLNLQQGGRTVIWYSLPWSRELYDQTNARVARRGQKLVPQVFRLVAGATIDDVIVETLEQRNEGQRALLQALTLLKEISRNSVLL